MSTFIGKYEVKADAKGRIFVPSVYRKMLPQADKSRVVMRRDADHDCLLLYPEDVWNRKVESFKEQLDEWNPEDQLLLMQFVADAEWLDVDSQGRVLISRRHLEDIGVNGSDLLFVGMLDRMAVWGRRNFEKSMLPAADFASRLKNRMLK